MPRIKAEFYLSEQQRDIVDSLIRKHYYSRCDHVRELLHQQGIVMSRSVLYRYTQQLKNVDVTPINTSNSTIIVMIECQTGKIKSMSIPVVMDDVLAVVQPLARP